ncbi:MAG: hypothetical protein NW208_13180 [Bryobacter sp.]|nr:hypothetical protein [Bryobacter sp.]
MAKMKPPRGGRKAGATPASQEKITARSFVGAIPCLVVVLIAMGLLSMLFYAALSNSLKSGAVK